MLPQARSQYISLSAMMGADPCTFVETSRAWLELVVHPDGLPRVGGHLERGARHLAVNPLSSPRPRRLFCKRQVVQPRVAPDPSDHRDSRRDLLEEVPVGPGWLVYCW